VYKTKTRQYILMADRCILQDKALVARIIVQLNLSPADTVTTTDSHYRCFRCLRQRH
jgi:hypothetical protein